MRCPRCNAELPNDTPCPTCPPSAAASASSDNAGKVAAGMGAIGGGASALLGVSSGAAARTAGGAAMTSGLAAVGSVVGGGMAAGIAVVAAAPIVGAITFYGVYRLYKRLATQS